MGITNSDKRVSRSTMGCDETLTVTLALTAVPNITEQPTDIVLVLDRSGSMAGSPMTSMKAGARAFIDIIANSTGGAAGTIGSGSRMAVVSFANTAAAETAMITSTAQLKAAVNGLTAGGNTNHADAFAKATALFDPHSTSDRVIVLFTDGETTVGPDPSPVAAAARAAGTVIYAIGLLGSDGVDEAALKDWASDPDADHVAVTPDAAELEELFARLAEDISCPGATNIRILDRVGADFAIAGITPPAIGTATALDSRTLCWNIDRLGVGGTENAELTFTVRHTGQSSGTKRVNESIAYTDAEGSTVTFPDPTVTVDCGVVVQPQCPQPIDVTVGGCQDTVHVDVGEVYQSEQGSILQVDVTVKNVCPGRRTALAVILSEEDAAGLERPRGMKVLTLPAHNFASCRDVQVRCISFVLPEEDETDGCRRRCASARRLKVRCIAHPADSGFTCCGELTES